MRGEHGAPAAGGGLDQRDAEPALELGEVAADRRVRDRQRAGRRADAAGRVDGGECPERVERQRLHWSRYSTISRGPSTSARCQSACHACLLVVSVHHSERRVSAVAGVAGLVAIAAVTPGPNNFIVLRAASQAGIRGAWSAIAGVVLGGLG